MLLKKNRKDKKDRKKQIKKLKEKIKDHLYVKSCLEWKTGFKDVTDITDAWQGLINKLGYALDNLNGLMPDESTKVEIRAIGCTLDCLTSSTLSGDYHLAYLVKPKPKKKPHRFTYGIFTRMLCQLLKG